MLKKHEEIKHEFYRTEKSFQFNAVLFSQVLPGNIHMKGAGG